MTAELGPADLPPAGPWKAHAWPCRYFYVGNWKDGKPNGRASEPCTCGVGLSVSSTLEGAVAVAAAAWEEGRSAAVEATHWAEVQAALALPNPYSQNALVPAEGDEK